jgi:hypothetical protein
MDLIVLKVLGSHRDGWDERIATTSQLSLHNLENPGEYRITFSTFGF